MELEHSTLDDIAHELGKRGYHGVLAVDDLSFDKQGSEETRRGVCVIGHPAVAVGMADEAIRRARGDVDDHLYAK